MQSELVISKNWNSLLVNCIINLERNALSNAQDTRREILKINPVPYLINNADLEEKVCKALSLTGTKVKLDDLDACHRMKKKDKVIIIKFKNRKQRNDVIFKWKELNSKGDDVPALPFGRSLFINNSTCFKNQVLFYKWRQLKKLGKIFSYWFFNNMLHVKMDKNGSIFKIYYSCDLENLLQVVNIDDLINNSSS